MKDNPGNFKPAHKVHGQVHSPAGYIEHRAGALLTWRDGRYRAMRAGGLDGLDPYGVQSHPSRLPVRFSVPAFGGHRTRRQAPPQQHSIAAGNEAFPFH